MLVLGVLGQSERAARSATLFAMLSMPDVLRKLSRRLEGLETGLALDSLRRL